MTLRPRGQKRSRSTFAGMVDPFRLGSSRVFLVGGTCALRDVVSCSTSLCGLEDTFVEPVRETSSYNQLIPSDTVGKRDNLFLAYRMGSIYKSGDQYGIQMDDVEKPYLFNISQPSGRYLYCQKPPSSAMRSGDNGGMCSPARISAGHTYTFSDHCAAHRPHL